jgi:hypothetical protein
MDDTGQGLDDSVSSEDVGGEPGRARGYWSGSVTSSKEPELSNPCPFPEFESQETLLEGGKPSGQWGGGSAAESARTVDSAIVMRLKNSHNRPHLGPDFERNSTT